MQKFIDRADLQIRSVIALDHLKNYIYVEAEKEAHVKEVCKIWLGYCLMELNIEVQNFLILLFQACKGLRNIFSSAKVMLVPIKEMTDVLSVESKAVELSRDTWVRMKIGIYKGDLAKVWMCLVLDWCCCVILYLMFESFCRLLMLITYVRKWQLS